ncbi:DUF6048 family protein [Cellulophaga sp. Hel_I_12]|uniref:DUF6048 family protein n=1 Tax=Cellulophaga sp. Hel_I_12 TaxID=1249972 RepID=UPI000645BD85|nr:DUF6048 family protein [Cellulophaga sp. Hel_I_12]
MSKYSISICLFLMVSFVWSQSKPIDLQPKDTVPKTQKYGLRVGVDLSKIVLSTLDEDYTGLELVGDYRLKQNLFAAAELGNEELTKQEDVYNFTTSGSYLKLGVDYNVYENWFGMNNLIHVGGRYAFSTFSNTLNNYQVFSTNRYFENEQFAFGSDIAEEFSGLNASWIEAVIGTKVELFSNIYLGASVRLGLLITNKEDDRFPNLWIPGFNKVTDNSKFGASYNYSLSYFIPLYKKKKEAKNTKKENEKTPPKE